MEESRDRCETVMVRKDASDRMAIVYFPDPDTVEGGSVFVFNRIIHEMHNIIHRL